MEVDEMTFYGYCFDENGRYDKGVKLVGVHDVFAFLTEKMSSFKEVRIVDHSDYMVLQAINGKIVFPCGNCDDCEGCFNEI